MIISFGTSKLCGETMSNGIPQWEVLGPLLFLAYINDFADNFISDVRLFADDTSLYHVVTDADVSTDVLNHDLKAVENWAFQWKMSFNPTKQVEQVIFFSSLSKVHIPQFISITQQLLQFHIINTWVIKTRRDIGIIRYMARYAHRDYLDQMCKLYLRTHSDYGDVVFHSQNLHLRSMLESTKYNAGLAVSGAWRGTSTDEVL